MNDWKKKKVSLGYFIAILGLLCTMYFLFAYDTTVEVPEQTIYGVTINGERVYNTGLMQNRQTGILIGIVAVVVGLGMRVYETQQKNA